MSQAPDRARSPGVPAGGPGRGVCRNWCPDPGQVRSWPRTGVRRRVQPGVLEAWPGRLARVSPLGRKEGKANVGYKITLFLSPYFSSTLIVKISLVRKL